MKDHRRKYRVCLPRMRSKAIGMLEGWRWRHGGKGERKGERKGRKVAEKEEWREGEGERGEGKEGERRGGGGGGGKEGKKEGGGGGQEKRTEKGENPTHPRAALNGQPTTALTATAKMANCM